MAAVIKKSGLVGLLTRAVALGVAELTAAVTGPNGAPVVAVAELLKMPLTETDITLVCVSNEVGGTYNGNARWLGVPLAGLLRRAGVHAGADQVLSAATDGMTISTPVATIMDGRNALVAVGMNGQPLPVAHGFPARMVVPSPFPTAPAAGTPSW